MSTAILLTGHPGCGKTTLIQRVVARLECAVGGFYTEEMRENGVRVGFKMLTFDGQQGILAGVGLDSPYKVGKYGVDVAALDAVGVASVRRALAAGALVVIDEIGPMEGYSAAFRQIVLEALDSDGVIFGSIVRRSQPFSDAIKAWPGVTLLEVTLANRDSLVETVLAHLRGAGC
jgi:nucleoside-triphosphatase